VLEPCASFPTQQYVQQESNLGLPLKALKALYMGMLVFHGDSPFSPTRGSSQRPLRPDLVTSHEDDHCKLRHYHQMCCHNLMPLVSIEFHLAVSLSSYFVNLPHDLPPLVLIPVIG